MGFPCRDEKCKKSFSTRFNRNKHEKLKGHAAVTSDRKIPMDETTGLFKCPTINCTTTSKYKYNIVKHLKTCHKARKNKKDANEKKVCSYCNKEFTKKSNRDRHVKNLHTHDICAFENEEPELQTPTMADIPCTQYEVEEQHDNQNETVAPMPLNAVSIEDESELLLPQNEVVIEEPVQFEYLEPSTSWSATDSQSHNNSNIEEELEPPIRAIFLPSKKRRLEAFIRKIAADVDYTETFNRCVIEHLKLLLRDNKKEAVNYMKESFGTLLEESGFLAWLAKTVDVKLCRLKNLLETNKYNKRNSHVTTDNSCQEIYDFWLSKSITSNDSANNTKKIPKLNFLRQFKNINDPDVQENEKCLKNGTKKVICSASKKIYTESIRKLHEEFNETKSAKVSLSVFYNLKPFYCLPPSEKEKQSCLCINCLNPHVLLKSINGYRSSKKLAPHKSLTAYLKQMKAGDKFDEMSAEKVCKYYQYNRVVESYIGKEGTRIEYTRTTRTDHSEPVHKLVAELSEASDKYLKHRTYVDNCNSVFPLMKETYTGKFVELDYSQNLSLRPKDEVQSAHFSGRQFTLHCAIVEPTEMRYHYHLSDDTKHDAIFVDHVLRDIIEKYGIKNEDLWIQSDNASSQYKNKHSFGLLQQLADEFALRIIRTYGAAGHGKGVIDAMSSFGVKNILRKDIVTCDLFFNSSEAITDYLSKRKPHFCYTNIPAEQVTAERREEHRSLVIPSCMKQHLIVFESEKPTLLKEYLCSCNSCLQFDFKHCSNIEKEKEKENVDDLEDIEVFDDEDADVDREQQVFEFVETPTFVTLFTGSQVEPLYFVQVTEKGIAESKLSDLYGHVILPGERYFKGHYLKLVRSRNISIKQLAILPTVIYVSPDEIYDTYVDIDSNLQMDVNIYNSLLYKARI